MKHISAISLFLLTCLVVQPVYAARLSITGEATVSAVPDQAIITIGVETRAKDSTSALDENTKRTHALIEAMKAAGIEGSDLKTINFSIHPNFANSNASIITKTITGYTVQNNIEVRIRDLKQIGKLLDTAIRLGANRIGRLNFTVDDPAPLLAKARRLAVEDAMIKAQQYAEAANVKLGTIDNISERNNPPPSPRYHMSASPADVPIETGTVAFSASVNIVWEIE